MVEVAAAARTDAPQPPRRLGHDGMALGDLDRETVDGGHLLSCVGGVVTTWSPRPDLER